MSANKYILSLTIIIVAFFAWSKLNKADTVNINPDQSTSSAFLVDVRTPQEYQLGSVAGSVNIPLQDLESRLEEFKNKEKIIVFCRSGNRSGIAKEILEQNGYKNIINGGSWQQVQKSIENHQP